MAGSEFGLSKPLNWCLQSEERHFCCVPAVNVNKRNSRGKRKIGIGYLKRIQELAQLPGASVLSHQVQKH